MVVCDGGFMVIGFDSLWVVDGLIYSGFAGSWDLSKSVGIGVCSDTKLMQDNN